MYEQRCSNQACRKMLQFKTFDFSKYTAQAKFIHVLCKACDQKNSIPLSKLAAAFEPIHNPNAENVAQPQAAQAGNAQQAQAPLQSNETQDLKAFLAQGNLKTTPPAPVLGWVIVHDELTEKQTYHLKMGTNVIGRWDKTIKAEFQIKTEDGSMSRRHCVIEVKQDSLGRLKYTLYDVGKLDNKPSLNGTFLNEKPLHARRLPDGKIVFSEYLLNDGDTIQMSITKMVLKLPTQQVTNLQDAERIVDNMGYRKTIILNY
jgi:FHA domain